MNLKAKIVPLVGAGLLALGLSVGPALADTTQPSVTITLNGGATTCSATLQHASLGTYNYVNGQYQQDTTDPGTLAIKINVVEAFGEHNDTCDVTASISVLQALIGGTYYQLNSTPINLTSVTTGISDVKPLSTVAASPSTLGTALTNGTTYTWNVDDLSSTLNANQQTPGVYSGVLTLNATVTAP